ncbi:hypothetical protein [Paenibacillus wynnii]|uniref:Gfo/Idh/MocA-like oxidoreductase N-terminal domain-containing protein n=1 Tax=Paenibacillus wynnii TaxID=268407 RepID=A0A098M4T7_9BACL|nr:hypothetical protein [Paenibacillus wynnii]KGE17066.1 hypothetical protein PWYN_20630 [Paenibacillus wynnii]
MKRIGFIDYFLDEWHANQYPDWIEQSSGGTMKVTCAYGKVDAPNGRTNADWCRDKGIELLPTIQAVIDSSDYLIVLSPDHPEFHEELSLLPLQSGKPTYVDKTFAPDRETANKMFERAAQHNTPLYSSSALRFAPEYGDARDKEIDTIFSQGPGKYSNYAVHQIEPIVSLMGVGAKRVMSVGTELAPALLIEYPNGRQASILHIQNSPFLLTLQYENGESARVTAEADFFAAFIDDLVHFFKTGISTVPPEETILVITLIEYGSKAREKPYQWIELPVPEVKQ